MTKPFNTRVHAIGFSMLAGAGVGYEQVSTRVDRALALMDPDRLTSAIGILSLADRDAGSARADANLSAKGQSERIKSIAASRLENLASIAKEIPVLEAEYLADEVATLAGVMPSADIVEALIDRDLAAHFREKGSDVVTLKLTGSARMRLAVARMPAELSGISEQQQVAIRHSMVPQTIAARLDAESQAISAARKTMQAAIDSLSSTAESQHRDLVGLFGNHWKFQGATTPEERMARITSQMQDGEAA